MREPASRWVGLHVALAVVVCLALPALSWLDGSGRLAYTMFSELEETRVDIVGFDASGRETRIAPTWVASQLKGGAGVFLAGAEHWRTGPVAREPLRQLGAIARRVCALGGHARVRVTVWTRRPSTAETPTLASVTCPR